MNSASFFRSRPARLSLAFGSGLVAVAALAGCSQQSGSPQPGAAAENDAPAASSPSTPTSTGATSGGSTGSSSFKDGTYSATGDYTSPGGASAVAVTVTLKSGVVTDVKVEPKAEDPTAQQYESLFASGIKGQIVGKKISDLDVTKVSGSSLTSQGFDKAIADIEQQAS